MQQPLGSSGAIGRVGTSVDTAVVEVGEFHAVYVCRPAVVLLSDLDPSVEEVPLRQTPDITITM